MKFYDYREERDGFERWKLSCNEFFHEPTFESDPTTWDNQLLEAVTRLEENMEVLKDSITKIANILKDMN